MPWSPEQYDRFRRERELPFVDALALVGELADRPRMLDLGKTAGGERAFTGFARTNPHPMPGSIGPVLAPETGKINVHSGKVTDVKFE